MGPRPGAPGPNVGRVSTAPVLTSPGPRLHPGPDVSRFLDVSRFPTSSGPRRLGFSSHRGSVGDAGARAARGFGRPRSRRREIATCRRRRQSRWRQASRWEHRSLLIMVQVRFERPRRSPDRARTPIMAFASSPYGGGGGPSVRALTVGCPASVECSTGAHAAVEGDAAPARDARRRCSGRSRQRHSRVTGFDRFAWCSSRHWLAVPLT